MLRHLEEGNFHLNRNGLGGGRGYTYENMDLVFTYYVLVVSHQSLQNVCHLIDR